MVDIKDTHRRPGARRRRAGFTLIELLVVILIIGMVTVAAIPLMSSESDARRIREGARLLSSMLSNAQAKARATGRSAGVWLDPLGSNPAAVMNLYIAETPPPYCGDTVGSVAKVTLQGGIPSQISFPSSDYGWNSVKPGDLVKLNYRGSMYQVDPSTSTKADGTITTPNVNLRPAVSGQVLPQYPSSTPTLNVPFQVFRQPVRSMEGGVAIADGAAIDLQCSGTDTSNFSIPADKAHPIIVTFDSTGTLEFVYVFNANGTVSLVRPLTGVYFLIGRIEKVLSAPLSGSNESQSNMADFGSRWVGVTRQAGLITTAEMAAYTGSGNIGNDLYASRRFVRGAQNMGGQ